MTKRKTKNQGSRLNSLSLKDEAKTSVIAIFFLGIAVVLLLSSFDLAGPIGGLIFEYMSRFLGLGYYLIPLTLILSSLLFTIGESKKIVGLTIIGSLIFVSSGLGLIDIVYPEKGGLVGTMFGLLEIPFGKIASVILHITILIAGIIIAVNAPLRFIWRRRTENMLPDIPKVIATQTYEAPEKELVVAEPVNTPQPQAKSRKIKEETAADGKVEIKAIPFKSDYVPPPIDLLKTSVEKPTVGDLRANANIIKRTLESFGIPVEMGEITIGPKVTRYTLKPAEGVKLSRITALNQDLALALAAHPIRIEAPIPGKSLVGIEIPNKIASIVRLGNLINYKEFIDSGQIGFVVGRDVSGDPIFANLAKMPHMLIAGSTGSGKSISIHTLLISLLYKNSPETMRLLLIDPKRVELSIYEGIPHLIAPVITEGKKSVAALRFAIDEMDRRYGVLLRAGKRDISGYNEGRKDELMPYLVVVIDELADLMATFGRDIEAYIVRLAQMARATGIHLVVSTQRPSVEVITGLIKANITSRIALQVASQIDSRTILDSAGAEKLLGGGDMLFVSSELSKPKRIQGAYITSDEIKSVIDFLKKNNQNAPTGAIEENVAQALEKKSVDNPGLNDEDDLYSEAVAIVKEAGKASASLLQRRLKVGYARAARLLDIMEENGVVGPGEGAKPREIFIDQNE